MNSLHLKLAFLVLTFVSIVSIDIIHPPVADSRGGGVPGVEPPFLDDHAFVSGHMFGPSATF